MKQLACITIFVFISNFIFSQGQRAGVNFTFSSEKDLLSPKFLSEYLTHAGTTENEKVRAIFNWITDNISYRVKDRNRYRNYQNIEISDDFGDSVYLSKSTDEIIAEKVLKKRSAYCDGYARLFKTLCDFAGIKSEVVSGYAKTNSSVKVTGFNPNHKWNAVRIDSVWYLLDATWASGYTTMDGEFVQRYDPYYFLTSPQTFIKDHYPEDPTWTLMSDPPTAKEFRISPFKHDAFSHFDIVGYKPSSGIIEARIGDTIVFEIETFNRSKDFSIFPVFANPHIENDSTVSKFQTGQLQKLQQRYTVLPGNNWLFVVYNNEAVLRYRLNVKG
jgi:transglutaminase/protease-like cytokinesis protein 3